MTRITKQEWARDGGLSNPKLCRKWLGRSWGYYRCS